MSWEEQPETWAFAQARRDEKPMKWVSHGLVMQPDDVVEFRFNV
jgi:hypothetical protein